MSAQAMDAAERQQKESIQLVTFSNNLADLEMQLELSCNTVASRAYSAELISDQLMDEVLDKNPQSQHQRALYLVRKIRTAIGDSEQAENRMDTFVKILGREAPFRSLVKKMEDELTGGKKATQVLAKFQSELADLIQGSITSVATAAFSQGLIHFEVKDATVDPKAKQEKIYISRILEEVRRKIIQNHDNLRVFVEKVLKPIGPSVQHLTDRLSEALPESAARAQ